MATTTLNTGSLPREFVFNGSRIPDPASSTRKIENFMTALRNL
jgi:hypothetical protein